MRLETLSNEIVDAAKSLLRDHHELVSRMVWKRARFENWLQLCILDSLQDQAPELDIERAYPNSSERCDFWMSRNTGEAWLELKLCVTNYCSAFADFHKTRPITNQIGEVVRDLEKLRRVESEDRSVLVLAYPLPETYEAHVAWQAHLSRLREAASSVEESFSIELSRSDVHCKLVGYVLRP